MATYSLAQATKAIHLSPFPVFSSHSLSQTLGILDRRSLFLVIKRLIDQGILEKLERNVYVPQGRTPMTFQVANYLYSPSYVSFETALNYHGILSQFPYEMTNATSKKTISKVVDERVFSYTHIKKDLYWGYEKTSEGFLLATPEKALLDQAYLHTKGLKGLSLDEYDMSRINKSKLKAMSKYFPKLPL
ncbi:hypothetical protein HZB69_00160 [Candidatus Amesbacteria bacterium]|nr:hypothetical protein [Candidatus Amesbacteria bacterium]